MDFMSCRSRVGGAHQLTNLTYLNAVPLILGRTRLRVLNLKGAKQSNNTEGTMEKK